VTHRLDALRAEIARLGLDGVLIPRGDAFLGEYVPPSAERLAWVSGFTGSAGVALVTATRAILFVDGRYTTQAARECAPAWEFRHLIEQPPATVLKAEFTGARIGYDPWLHSEAGLERLSAAGVELVPLSANPVDSVWTDRPAPPEAPAVPHHLAFAGVDSATKREAAAAALREAGATVVSGEDRGKLPRACKNPVEQAGARSAHQRDAVALARFLAWFASVPRAGLTEMGAAAKLLALRGNGRDFVAESFPAIAGAGEHGAIVHYRATPETDRAIAADEVFLLDSGAQYRDGTTDVTRTMWTGPGVPPAELRARYTRVLQGHLALAAMRFPEGVAGPHLDAIARRALWEAGLDYDHGTGHGIGSFLSVHEGPAGISRAAKPVALKPGMILSDEPGFYAPGEYGIRIENLLLVQAAEEQPGQRKPFLRFEVLTLAPYDRALIEVGMLTPGERAQVDAYHARVLSEVGPLVEAGVRGWLKGECAPL